MINYMLSRIAWADLNLVVSVTFTTKQRISNSFERGLKEHLGNQKFRDNF